MLAYMGSFATVLITWINHNRLFEQIRRKDHGLLVFNGLLLMVITLFPLPTALLAEYIRHPGADAKVAAAVYSAVSLVMALFFNLLWRHASSEGGRLLAPDHDRRKARHITEQYRYGPILYLAAFGLAFVSAAALNLLLAVFFALPERPGRADAP